MKTRNTILFGIISVIPYMIFASDNCQVVATECLDNAPTKIINGIEFNLANACAANNLSGVNCCWNLSKNIVCNGQGDTCDPYRKNTACTLLENTCVDKDYITGTCNKFQSKYTCASGYQNVESRVCTNVVCADRESGTATQCYTPPSPSADNAGNLGAVIAYLQMGQNMAQDMKCSDNNHVEDCTLFAGKYSTCYMYKFDVGQPGSWNNNGADCGVQWQFFTDHGAPIGYEASDRNLYSQATSGTNSVMGSSTSYALSNDNSTPINTTVQLNQQANMPVVNRDQNINYMLNNSRNSKLSIQNGQVSSVSINRDTVQDLSGFLSFEAYLSDQSVNLAWNRLKGESDPRNMKTVRLSDLGVSRRSNNNIFGWNSGTSQPVINGLCVHLADSCLGGNRSGTSSDLVKGEFSYAGGYSNPNFCAACTNELLGACITGTPKPVVQQWCCFSSKVAMDINLAAYDQGLLDFYNTSRSRHEDQRYEDLVRHSNGICGGVTVGMISRIDFSRANYFKDMMDNIDINQIIDTTNFTNVNVQGNTQGRSNNDATGMVNEWKQKYGS